MERFALYFAPPPMSDLAGFGASWLGRDAYTGEMVARDLGPDGEGDPDAVLGTLTESRLQEITESPRHYGFHATLKAPFALAPGTSEAALIDAVDAFCARTSAFEAPSLTLTNVHGFTALVLEEPSAKMAAFHTAIVKDFDSFRAPMTPEDRERRRPDRLSERQRAHLDQWGYPHIFEDFFFHMTLTGRLTDPAEIDEITDLLEPVVSVIGAVPLVVEGLCVFHQPDRNTPFRVRHRAPLQGA